MMPKRGLRHPGWPAPSEIDAQPIDWQNPINRGLVGYWPNLLGAGDRLRGFGSLAGNAVAVNGVTSRPDPMLGMVSDFDGDTSSRYWDAPFAWSGGPVSVSFWVYQDSAVSGKSWFGTNHDGSNLNRFQCHAPYASSNTVYWDYGNDGGGGRLTTSFAGYYGRWVHVTLVSSGGTGTAYMGIYFDGKLVASQASASNPTFAATTAMHIGAWPLGGGRYFTGSIADFHIYDYVLSAEEIWNLYAPQTRWHMLRAWSTRRWFTPGGTPPTTSGFRLINGRQYRPGSLVA